MGVHRIVLQISLSWGILVAPQPSLRRRLSAGFAKPGLPEDWATSDARFNQHRLMQLKALDSSPTESRPRTFSVLPLRSRRVEDQRHQIGHRPVA